MTRIIDLSTGFSSNSAPSTIGYGAYGAYAAQSVTNASTITVNVTDGFQLRPISGNGGAVTTASAPFGALSFVNGQVITLVCTSDTNTVTIAYADVANGVLMNGDLVLEKGSVASFMYSSVLSRFVLM